MAQINFPTATSNGQQFEADNGVIYTYVGTPPNGYWSGTFQNQSYATLDSRYLKLDSSNDPITAGLNITGGNVGIGTTSPSQKLEVTGAIVATGAASTYSSTGLYIQNKGSSIFDVGAWRSGASVAELTFSTDSGSDTAPVERMRIDFNGNVGIGTPSPQTLLEVLSPNSAAESIASFGNTAIARGLEIVTDGNTAWGFNARNSRNLVFQTAQSERMRIDSSGNVGIGTDSPAQKLVVIGSSNDTIDETTGTVCFRSAGGNGLLFGTKSSSPYRSYIQSAFVTDTSVAQYDLLLNPLGGDVGIGTESPNALLHAVGSRNYSGSTPGLNSYDVNIQSGTAVVSIGQSNGIPTIQGHGTGTGYNLSLAPNAGRVGVGTTAPITDLTVRTDTDGSEGGNLCIQNTGAGQNTSVALYLCPNNGGGNDLQRSASIRSRQEINGNYADLEFYTADSDTPREHMRITRTGRVGIGTSSPFSQFHLQGTAPYVRYTNTGAPADEKNWDFNAGTDGILRFRNSNDANNSSNNWLEVERSGATTDSIKLLTGSGSERLRIDSSGNVGIGTASPAAKLHISGSGQTTNSVNTAGNNNLLVSDTGTAVANGGSIIFAAASGSWRFGAIKAIVTSGTNNSTGHLAFCTRRNFNDATLTENFRALQSGGITFNGDDVAANALDDYEEGTWTPGIQNGTFTYTKQIGTYTKVGNIVNANIFISWSLSSGTGAFRVNLPITAYGNSSNNRFVGTLGYHKGMTRSDGDNLVSTVSGGSTSLGVYGVASNGSITTYGVQLVDPMQAGELQITITYQAA